MTSYNDWFNMSKPATRKDINPSVEHNIVNKSYNEVAGIQHVTVPYFMPTVDMKYAAPVLPKVEVEPAPIEEGIDWKDAYPKSMLQPDVESDLWMHKDDIAIAEPVDNTVDDASVVEPDEHAVETIEDSSVLENEESAKESVEDQVIEENTIVTEETVKQIEEPVVEEVKPEVKKKNTRRTKKK